MVRRRSAAAVHAHPQRAARGRRPGRLFGDVLARRRHDRRRHALPAGRQQLPLDLRDRVLRRVAALGRRRTAARRRAG